MAINFFGDEVPEPVLTPALKVPREPKPIRKWVGNPTGTAIKDFTPEQRKLYNREKKKEQYRREAEEETRKEVIKQSQKASVDYESYGSRQLEEYITDPPRKQVQEVFDQETILVNKILDEVGKDPHTDRIDGETIHQVVTLAYGIQKGYIDANPAGLFCVGRFVDLNMVQTIEAVHNPPSGATPRYDRPWNTSKSFLDAYRNALRQSLNLCLNYPQLTEKHLVKKIQDEWNRSCKQQSL